MGQDNQFYQYGYDHYLKAPTRPMASAPVRSRSGVRARLLRKLQSPAVASVALLVAGALFVGVIYVTYPSGDKAQQEIPIVKADLRPIKMSPEERGGMDIPNRDSTLLARVGQPPNVENAENVENLLARSKADLISKERALEQAMAQSHAAMPSDDALVENPVTEDTQAAQPVKNLLEQAQAVEPPALKEPSANDILQKIGSSEGDDAVTSSEFEQKVADAAVAAKPVAAATAEMPQKPETIHAAATSPETIEFVRSVLSGSLDDDTFSPAPEVTAAAQIPVQDVAVAQDRAPAPPYEQQRAVAPPAAVAPAPYEHTSPAAVEPAAGAASPVVAITAGDAFVQLASITDPARAGSEWAKMQAKYSVLSNVNFRIQEASLSNGTFYRIQAGPMSKASADSICESLKQAGKPGGCLVVK